MSPDYEANEFIKPNAVWSVRYLKEHINRYAFALCYVRNRVVLDVACGIGYGAQYLKRQANCVVGGDISEEALRYASRDFSMVGLDFLRLDAQALPFADESFDVIVSFETIEHLPNYEAFLDDCSRCLTPQGTFICSTPNKRISSPDSSKTSSVSHAHEFYPDEFIQLINNYFTNLRLYGQEEWWTYREIRLARLASSLKRLVVRLPGIEHLIDAVAHGAFKDYALARLSNVKFEELIDEKFRPTPVRLDCVAPFLIVVASKGPGSLQ